MCPHSHTGFLLSRFKAGDDEPSHRAPQDATSCRWIKKHFEVPDPASTRVQFPPFAFRRYLGFVRFREIAVSRHRLSIGFDIFVGPAEYPLPLADGGKEQTSARAIHGFADIAHYATFQSEIASGEASTITGHAALCLVRRPDAFLGSGWRLQNDCVLQPAGRDEVRAMLAMEATAQWRQRHMRFHTSPAIAGKPANSERGVIFRARLALKLPDISHTARITSA
jgi:hypothetical protein